MRKVFPNAMVAHLWANQSQEEARSGNGQFYFSGDTIYSYGSHFPIAKHVIGQGGRTGVLFTTCGYSNTTAKHITIVRRALRQELINGATVFNVDLIKTWDGAIDHARNWKNYSKALADRIEEGKKARAYGVHACERARNTVAEANRYAEFFELPARMTLPEGFEVIEQRATEKAARHEAAQVEQRRRDRERAEHQRARERAQAIAALPRWQAGEDVYVNWYSLDHADPTFLRVKDDELQTSKGARVPLDHAIRTFKVIAQCRAQGREYVRNGHTIHVGHFAVDRITPDGTLYAGCHVIQWAEIERIANQLGILNAAQ